MNRLANPFPGPGRSYQSTGTGIQGPDRNRILSSIRGEERARIFPHLTVVEWRRGEIIYETRIPQLYAYFPVDSLVSITHFLEDGHSCEIAVVGNCGMLGISIFTQAESMPEYAVVQAAGTAYRLKASILREEANRSERFRLLMLRYTQVLLAQISQSATCNRYHTIHQQLARWLLIATDYLPRNQLELTQEQIAHSLGVRREGVTEAAGRLQKEGLIEYRRGRINVVDRLGLEQVCCECYQAVKCETARLLPD
jgi:CRP-like cAMP-binding protein